MLLPSSSRVRHDHRPHCSITLEAPLAGRGPCTYMVLGALYRVGYHLTLVVSFLATGFTAGTQCPHDSTALSGLL